MNYDGVVVTDLRKVPVTDLTPTDYIKAGDVRWVRVRQVDHRSDGWVIVRTTDGPYVFLPWARVDVLTQGDVDDLRSMAEAFR